MRKFVILLTLGMFIMPINSWAYSARVDIVSPWGSGYSQVHGDSSIQKLGGSLFGNYSAVTASLTGISGTLRGLWGFSPTQKVVVNGGYFNNDGSGELKASVYSYKDGGYWRNVGNFLSLITVM